MAANTKEDKSKTGQKSFFGKISRSIKDMRGEMKRVVWPSKKQLINNTIIVLVFMVLAGLVIGGVDSVLTLLVRALLGTAS